MKNSDTSFGQLQLVRKLVKDCAPKHLTPGPLGRHV
jgi:hypothetical protein